MYEIIFDEEAIGFLSKISKKLKERIFNKIISTKESPFQFFERLKGRKDYKLRAGSYRIIADIDKKKKIIEVTLIDHRGKVYKSLK